MDKWAKANNVKLTRVPMAYNIFMEKVTATLTSGNDQFDVIWHNDDWGQLWKKWLEPTDDVKGMENMNKVAARRVLVGREEAHRRPLWPTPSALFSIAAT